MREAQASTNTGPKSGTETSSTRWGTQVFPTPESPGTLVDSARSGFLWEQRTQPKHLSPEPNTLSARPSPSPSCPFIRNHPTTHTHLKSHNTPVGFSGKPHIFTNRTRPRWTRTCSMLFKRKRSHLIHVRHNSSGNKGTCVLCLPNSYFSQLFQSSK